MESSNEDEEPQIYTVFASPDTSGSKTVFDTIAFSIPKKEGNSPSTSIPSNSNTSGIFTPPTASATATGYPSVTELQSTPTSTLFNQQVEIQTQPEPQSAAVPTFHADQQQQQQATATFPSVELGDNDIAVEVDIFAEIGEPITLTPALAPPVEDTFAESRSSIPQINQPLPQQVHESVTGNADVPEQIAQAMMDSLCLKDPEDMEGPWPTSQSPQQLGQGEGKSHQTPHVEEEPESPIPTANSLFADAPDVLFPVSQFAQPQPQPQLAQFQPVPAPAPAPVAFPAPFTAQPQPDTQPPLFFNTSGSTGPSPAKDLSLSPPPITSNPPLPQFPTSQSFSVMDTFSFKTASPLDAAYDAWIPTKETRNILTSIATAVRSGTHFPDKTNMTTPGIIYEDDLIDKVGVNMGRIFGEAEASKRRILTADNVTQDDNGLRELIKLGCYRSAINLTKRLLTLYGQGPGKVGQFSKHNPHTLQLWFTRISLLIRIREFAIAESEIDAFKEFDHADLFYEYYPDSYGTGRKGSMVPFHFRVLASEILQYSRKHNETIDRLTRILRTVEQILHNLSKGKSEDGSETLNQDVDGDRKEQSLEIWRKRENRVYYALTNASLFAKDYLNTLKYMNVLCEKDAEKEPQLKSAIGRLFLQLGDLTTANKYFQISSELRNGDSDSEQVENLVDSAMITIAHGGYPEAFALLQQALLIQPDNFMITNNMAVCLLYMGKVKESLALMETTVKNNTPQLLQENVLLNLSTIYELENTDGHKKNSLLKLISEYKGDGINLASLKMPNLI